MTNLQAKILSVVTCSQFFFLLVAAPLLALGREERLVPPLPIPHVARTAAHLRTALSPPLPRPRPATPGSSPATIAQDSSIRASASCRLLKQLPMPREPGQPNAGDGPTKCSASGLLFCEPERPLNRVSWWGGDHRSRKDCKAHLR
jgi:hypothetical protein